MFMAMQISSPRVNEVLYGMNKKGRSAEYCATKVLLAVVDEAIAGIGEEEDARRPCDDK